MLFVLMVMPATPLIWMIHVFDMPCRYQGMMVEQELVL